MYFAVAMIFTPRIFRHFLSHAYPFDVDIVTHVHLWVINFEYASIMAAIVFTCTLITAQQIQQLSILLQ